MFGYLINVFIPWMQVSRLERVYTLKYFPQALIVQCEKAEFNVDENQFIVHEDYMNSWSEINKELASYFSRGDMHCCRELKYVYLHFL